MMKSYDRRESFEDSQSGLDQPIDRTDSDQALLETQLEQQKSVFINQTHILLRNAAVIILFENVLN